MHRSGTSLAAKIISAYGAYFGDNLMQADHYNTEGYWEHTPLVDFHNKLLAVTGNKWFAPNENFDTRQLVFQFGDEARQLVQQMDQKAELWCWKDPRMPLFLNFWEEILSGRNICYVVPYRHPLSVAASLLKRDQLPVMASLALWEATANRIFKFLANKEHSFFADFDNITENPEESCLQLLGFLNTFTRMQLNTKVLKEMVNSRKKTINIKWPEINMEMDPVCDEIFRIYKSGRINGFSQALESKNIYWENLFTQSKNLPFTKDIFSYAQLFVGSETFPFTEADSIIAFVYGNQETLSFQFKTPVNACRFSFVPV